MVPLIRRFGGFRLRRAPKPRPRKAPKAPGSPGSRLQHLRPALTGLAALGGGALLVNQAGSAATAFGQAAHPPAQSTGIDTDGDGIPESQFVLDPKTGQTWIFGEAPSEQTENDRQQLPKAAIYAAAAVGAVALVAVIKK